MSKRKDIRKGMEQIIKEWIIHNYPIGSEMFSDLVKRIQEFESSEGVVIRVERELPSHGFIDVNMRLNYKANTQDILMSNSIMEAYILAQQDMTEAGYVVVSPLIKE